MKKIYTLSLFLALFLSTALSAQPWWVENVLFIDAAAGPNGANGHGQCIVHFQPGASTSYNAQFDAQVFPPGANSPFLFSMKNYVDTTKLGVNGFPSLTQDYLIPLGFRPGYTGTHTFTFEDSASFVMPKVVFLEDRTTNTFTNVITTPTYTFNATIGENANNRFVLHCYGLVNLSSTNSDCSTSGSIQIGPGGSEHWLTYTLKAQPSNTVVASGDYVLPTTINSLAAGQYLLTLTDAYGLTYSSPFTITSTGSGVVASLSNIVNPACPGELGSATISATGNGSVTITWDTEPAQTGATATNLTPGTYTATASAGGCSDTVQVTILPPPAISVDLTAADDTILVGEMLTFTADVTGASTIGWDFNDGESFISPIYIIEHGFDNPGIYTVVVTSTEGCNISDEFTVVVLLPDGISEAEGTNAKVWYGNGKLNISYPGQSNLNVALYNVAGQQIGVFSNVAGNGGVYSIATNPLATGVYYVKASDGKRSFVTKIGVAN